MKKFLLFLVPLTFVPIFKIEPAFSSCSRIEGAEYQKRCQNMSKLLCDIAANNGVYGTAYASEVVKGAYQNGLIKSQGMKEGPAWVNSFFLNAGNQSRKDCLMYAPQFFGTFR